MVFLLKCPFLFLKLTIDHICYEFVVKESILFDTISSLLNVKKIKMFKRLNYLFKLSIPKYCKQE